MRPLYDDGASKAQEATRDYVLKADGGDGEAPLVNVFGGKITTYRRLAESMLEKIEASARQARASRGPRTRRCRAATFAATGFDAEVDEAEGGLSVPRPARMRAGWSGSTARAPQRCSASPSRMPISAANFGADLYEAEVRYLMEHEWAVTAEDVLWRRTKRGLQAERRSRPRRSTNT